MQQNFFENEKLSLIIPVYNEEDSLEKIINKILSTNLYIKKELIIIDDCSTDNSLKIAKKLEKENKQIKVFAHEKNKGKGSAIRTGFSKAKGTIIGIQDADLEYNPKEYNKLLLPILLKRSRVVYGSRFLNKYTYKKNKFYFANKILSLLTSILYFRKITDMETCYKFFRKELLNDIELKSKKFDIEPELTAKFIKKGEKIIEVPINYIPRTQKQGKKIKPIDGIIAIYTLLKYRF